jgi:hypothetical protein
VERTRRALSSTISAAPVADDRAPTISVIADEWVLCLISRPSFLPGQAAFGSGVRRQYGFRRFSCRLRSGEADEIPAEMTSRFRADDRRSKVRHKFSQGGTAHRQFPPEADRDAFLYRFVSDYNQTRLKCLDDKLPWRNMSDRGTQQRDFWLSSGFHLLARDGSGHLAVTDDFLRAYLFRPEMLPSAESCPAEIALHDALLADPRQSVGEARLTALADADVRDNYRVVLRFRDRLVGSGTLEAAYLNLFRDGGMDLPPLFIDHLAHAILRNLLDGARDPFRWRAAELFFRSQKVSLDEGGIMLADEETVERQADGSSLAPLERLVAQSGASLRGTSLDVLIEENAASYLGRSDRFDMVLDLSFGRPGLDAFCRVLEAWVAHLLGISVQIEPVGMIRDEHWSWHIGLDTEASAILDELYRGHPVDEARLGRILSLFRLGFRDAVAMRPDLAGRPVYLGLAMTQDRRLRLKPQNLLVNLPLARPA